MAPPLTIAISDDDNTTTEGNRLSRFPSLKRDALSKRKRHSEPVHKIEWSDESEGDWEAFKRRTKGKAPKKVASNAKGKGSRVSKGTSTKAARNKNKTPANDDSASDTDVLERALPDYLRERRRAFDDGRRALDEAGLRLPPRYDDIYFSDDEAATKLEEKPQFDRKSGIKPSHAYKDIALEYSAGIIPAPLAQYLRDYQVEGVKFLHHLFVYQRGGILGDDMGLGKTVQVAAFLTAAFGKTGDRRDAKRMRKFRRSSDDWYPRVLIICPGSVTQNWKNELDRWGWWEADLYHGPAKDDVLETARAGRLEVMITTYTTYKNHCDQINRVPWDVVVADECHSIKDSAAGVTVAMNQVNSLCRIGLTGTAIQNKYEEFWTLLNWTNPGQFGTIAEWRRTISKPLTIGQSHDATLHQLSEARKIAFKLVNNLLPRFFLRRMKSLIAHQLPKKSDRVVFCPLSDLQREAYENLLASSVADFVRTSFQICSCGSERKRGWCCHPVNSDGESWKALTFPIIISLQKLSSHFSLLIPQTVDAADKQKRELRFLQAAMPERWLEFFNNRDSLLYLANPEFCGKWKVLRKLLKFWFEAGDKVLVFSHSVRLLRVLQHLFSNTSYSVSYLDGSLSYEDRQSVVDDFNSDPNQFAFLISTKAGGVGLNITSANKVVIMDPHWNPAYDLQAQDRAYRIGQTRDVDVFRLVSTGTIEEITYARQIYKQQQANIGYNASNERRYFKGVQQDSTRKGEIFGIENLLSYHGDQVVLRDIVNKTNVAEARAGIHLVDINMEQAMKDDGEALVKVEDGDDTGGLKKLTTILTNTDSKDSIRDGGAQTRNSDSIRAILAAAGVEYTHENSEVVGSSKIEDVLSRKAQLATSQDVEDQRALFFDSQELLPAKFEYRYNPPEDVRQRQFCTMAQTFGFSSATEFALAVEDMTQEQRRNTLDSFYEKRLEKLKQGAEVKREFNSGQSELHLKETPGTTGEEKTIKTIPVKAEDDVMMEDIEVYAQVKIEDLTSGHVVEETAESVQEKEEDSIVKEAIKHDHVVRHEVQGKRVDTLPTKPSRQSIIWLSDSEGDDEL